MIAGTSGGGGVCAGTALLARDRGGPPLCGQCLIYPMIDDRNTTVSAKQFMKEGIWTGENNAIAWDWILAGRRGSKDVSIYAAPARATDLSGLPPTSIDCGSAEVFRDENVAYASKLWEDGVQAELHVWPGAWHAFDMYAPKSRLAKVCQDTRMGWVRRILTAGPVTQKVSAVL
jgi:acetyl esterase/lipase